MGYGHFKELVKRCPKLDRTYFCKVCDVWNDPFDHKNNLEQTLKNNVCRGCNAKANKVVSHNETRPDLV